MKKEDYKNKIFQLKISLDESNPPIWRRVHVSTNMTLRGLHRLIQKLFLWKSYHLYLFQVGDIQYGDPELDEFGEIGWENDQTRRIYQIHKKMDSFSYVYDFGDEWCHTIKIEAILDAEKGVKYPFCIGGEQPAPPDDSGGIHGYYQMIESAQSGDDPEAQEYMEWLNLSPLSEFSIEDMNEFYIERRKVMS